MRSREDYNRAVGLVRAIIAVWDPYALIEGGAPGDEFDGEVAKIVTRIPRIASGSDAALAVSRVFSENLGEVFTPEECEEVGRRLFDILSSQGLVRGPA